jgi:hypothetical protein
LTRLVFDRRLKAPAQRKALKKIGKLPFYH